ncbi:MAG TPA: hypothetical protein VHB99_09000 [Pirellulales bacterium]|nr:hypothetical protein [Pirellulales bacterium]
MSRKAWTQKLLAITAVLPCIVACDRSPGGFDRYVPSAAQAEEALAQVMAAWKQGRRAGPLTLESAPVTLQVADSLRKPGQRLVDYELLGEVSGEGPRTFVVRLKLANPSEELSVRYYLVGIDPLWVFRQEDYDAAAHWDACEDPSTASGQPRPLAAAQ